MLVDGVWTPIDPFKTDGAYQRPASIFRHVIEPGGRFEPAVGRYHLYVSLACPWASRTIIVRKLKKLESVIGMTIVHPDMLENGWTFALEPDPLLGSRFLYEIYQTADAACTGRATVPVLWDKQTRTIVNNESADIIRILNGAFERWSDCSVDLYPADLRGAIDALNIRLYDAVNNGVYRTGFATEQSMYESAATVLFGMLQELDERLANGRFLHGDRLTESDIRLFVTAVRFDLVYYAHFKCNLRQFRDYPNLLGWMRDLYQLAGVAETVDVAHIKRHYYHSQTWINPTGIVPLGPPFDLQAAPNRRHVGAPC